MVLLDFGAPLLQAIHVGDCRLGRIDSDGKIEWLSRVHTLANAIECISDEELRGHDDRHVITRCFRPGRLCEFELVNYSNLESNNLIISTDGYWADLDVQEKANFINGRFAWTKPLQDDASCLVLSGSPNISKNHVSIEGVENFYFIKK